MPLKPVTPRNARKLMAQHNAVLIDIRSADEHARERIAQARHIPAERLAAAGMPAMDAAAVIYHCHSGNRTALNAQMLASSADCETYALEGGIEGWKKAGLPVETDASRPLELPRQVQIAAGSLILLGAVLGAAVSPWFHALSGAIGTGLIFAGMSGSCGLAHVLLKMPWNRTLSPTLLPQPRQGD